MRLHDLEPEDIIIDEELRDLIPPLSSSEEDHLFENIKADGIRDPLVVWMQEIGTKRNKSVYSYTLLDGHHRLEYAKKNSATFDVKVAYEVETRADAIIWMIKNQLGRRNLTNYTRSDLALQLKDIIAEQAKERQSAAGGDKKSEEAKSLPAISPEPVEGAGETREKLAKKAGVGSNTIAKVEFINKHGSEDLKSDLRDGKITVNKAYKQLKGETAKTKKPSTTEQAEQAVDEQSLEEQSFNEEFQRQIAKDKSPFHAMNYVDGAISMLSQIHDNDPDIEEAMDKLIAWAVKRKKTKQIRRKK